jgi:hypothetical protein
MRKTIEKHGRQAPLIFQLSNVLHGPDDEALAWPAFNIFIRWVEDGVIQRQHGNQILAYPILWEFGRIFQAPTYQNAVLRQLIIEDDFFQRISSEAISWTYQQFLVSGLKSIDEHKFLRFCLDVVAFDGPSVDGKDGLLEKLVKKGGDLAVLVATEAVGYALAWNMDPRLLPLGGKLDPTHTSQMHHYLVDECPDSMSGSNLEDRCDDAYNRNDATSTPASSQFFSFPEILSLVKNFEIMSVDEDAEAANPHNVPKFTDATAIDAEFEANLIKERDNEAYEAAQELLGKHGAPDNPNAEHQNGDESHSQD